MFFWYTLLYTTAFLVLLPREILKRPSKLRKRWLKERLGFISKMEKKDKKRVWIHAVSVGESIAARPVIKCLRQRGDVEIFATTVTDTGQQVMRAFLKEDEHLFYAPFDMPSAVERFVENIEPDLILIMETEIWPNLLRIAKRHSVRTCLINGRISESSYRGYRKISFFIKSVLEAFDCMCMQTEEDQRRILGLGAREDRVAVFGNLKFDVPRPERPPEWTEKLGRPRIVAGSTHEGEDEIVLEAFANIKRSFSEATLVIAPRHPERFELVAELIKKMGFRLGRRSKEEFDDVEVLLLDSIGELSSVYGGADVAVMGGSFVDKGGHNLFEPASWGVPIICGEYMYNFPLSLEFFTKGAALKTTPERLSDDILRIFKDKDSKELIGKKALDIYNRHAGAVNKTMEVINGLID